MSAAPGARLVAVLIVTMMVVTACGNDDAVTRSTEAVVFGQGSIPEAVPDDFPIPSNAVVGTTLVDKINNRSEFRLTVQADLTSTVQFFQIGLVNQGYIISSSEGSSTEWIMSFSDGEIDGQILSTPQGQGLSVSVISVNRS